MGKSVAELGATRFVGIDWAAEEHAVSVLDESGRLVRAAFTVAHSREGLETLVNRSAKPGPPARIPGGARLAVASVVERSSPSRTGIPIGGGSGTGR